jgi:hypothetical protein
MSYIYKVPTVFDDFIIHRSLVDQLRHYSKVEELQLSTVFYGQNLVGKRTIIQALIRHIIGQPIEPRIKKDTIYTHGNTMHIEFSVSPYHIEFHLEEYGLTDRYIVGDYIQRILSSSTIDDRIRIYVIYNIDSYTYETQDMFVNLIERHSSNARFLFTASSKNRIHYRIKSISSMYRVRLPSRYEIIAYLRSLKSLDMFQIESTANRVLNDGHLGTLRYKDGAYNDQIEMTWKVIEPLILRRDIESINDMKSHFYNMITLTLPTSQLLLKMCNYVITMIPKNNISVISDVQQKFTEINRKMNNIDYDIIGLEYAALVTKQYIHVIIPTLKDKVNTLL